MINEQDIKNGFAQIPRSRSVKRQKLINDISVLFLSLCKQNGILSFPRSHLNFLIEGVSLSKSKKRKIIQDVLNLMKEKGLISENIKHTAVYSFRNKPLLSFDYGSFALLMKKNGYKKYLYKWDNKNGYPQKHKVAVFEMDERLSEDVLNDFDFNERETKSRKRRDSQGVLSNGNLSVVRDFCFMSEKRIYDIL